MSTSNVWINVALDTISSVYVGSAVGLFIGCEDGGDNVGVEVGVPVFEIQLLSAHSCSSQKPQQQRACPLYDYVFERLYQVVAWII